MVSVDSFSDDTNYFDGNSDYYYYYSEPSYDQQTTPMWLTWDFQGVLMAIALAAVSVLVISALWNYCAREEESPAESLTQQSHPIIVHEIRPGVILLKGYPSHEETLRIVAEYDALRGGPGHAPFSNCSRTQHYGATANMPNEFVQPATVPMESYAVNGSLINLVDDTSPRPPPYAPVGQDPHAGRLQPPQSS